MVHALHSISISCIKLQRLSLVDERDKLKNELEALRKMADELIESRDQEITKLLQDIAELRTELKPKESFVPKATNGLEGVLESAGEGEEAREKEISNKINAENEALIEELKRRIESLEV